MAEPELTVRKHAYWVPLALDTDGTPLYNGERLVEVEPGHWMHPDAIALMEFLQAEDYAGPMARQAAPDRNAGKNGTRDGPAVTVITVEPREKGYLVTIEKGNGGSARTIELTELERAQLHFLLTPGTGTRSTRFTDFSYAGWPPAG